MCKDSGFSFVDNSNISVSNLFNPLMPGGNKKVAHT